MPKKTLQNWYNSNDITYSQKEIIKKYGVGDYYPECEKKDFLKIYYWNDILERNITKLEDGYSFPDSLIHQMNFFSTWWNNNLILVIDGKENDYWVKLIVYEMPYKKDGEIKMKEIFEVFIVDWICAGGLYNVRSKLKKIEEKLRSNNPILCEGFPKTIRISYNDDYNSLFFPVSYGHIKEEQIKKTEVDFNKARCSPNDYFKPLDIAMVFNDEWVHACIYLGNNQICHARYDQHLKKGQVKIESWEKFLFDVITPYQRKVIRYHPVIAFKKSDEIIKHIAKCVEGEENYYSSSNLKKGPFRIRSYGNYENSNNCENFVNRCVLGLDFSELNERKKEDASKREKELKIKENLEKTNYQLNKLTDYTPWTTINKIREYRRNSGYENFDVMRDGVNMYDVCIEVQPKTSIFKDMLKQHLNRQIKSWQEYKSY